MLGLILSVWAQERVVAVMPGVPVTDTTLRNNIITVLTGAGYEKALLMAPETLAEEVEVRALAPAAPTCHVPLDSWQLGVGMALDLMSEDEWEEAHLLVDQLEHDLSCLQGAPSVSALRRLRLVQLQVARLGEEEGNTWGDVGVALKRAAALGEAQEEGIDPEVLAEVAATRRRLPEALRVAVIGPGAGQVRLDGMSPKDGLLQVIPGEHRLWIQGDTGVTGVGTLSLAQPTVLWVGAGAPGSLTEVVGALPRREPTPGQQSLLMALTMVVDQPLVFLGMRGRQVDLWKADDLGLRRWEPMAAAREFGGDQVDSWRAAYGVGLTGGWSNVPILEGAGGGLGVYARWRLNDRLQAAFSVFPLMRPSETGFDAVAPIRLGIRYGRNTSAWTADFGLDAGLEWLGAFDPQSTGFLLGGAAGASGSVAPRTALRVEAWGAAGLDHGMFGLWFGVEGRLRARATLSGEGR